MIADVPPALIIGGGSANGLGIARNLGSLGIPVYCVTSNPHELTCFSKYCQGYTIVPRVESDPATLRQYLSQFLPGTVTKRVLFPTTDTALLTTTQIRFDVPDYVTYLPSREIVETMVFKSKFYQSLTKWGVPHPRTLFLNNATLPHMAEQVEYPVYLRPVQSLLFRQRFGVKGFVAQNLPEVQRFLHMVRQHHLDVMLQEIIPGPTRALYHLRGYFDRNRRPIVLLASQKLRQPTMFSDNTALVSIPLSELAEGVAILLRYFHNIGYTGLFGADFKRDPRDGVFKLLEVNARSQGGNLFGVACGANHVLTAYHDSLGVPVEEITEYRIGTYFYGVLSDLNVLWSMAIHGRLSAHDLIPFFQDRHWNVLSRDDFRPFLKHLWLLTTRTHARSRTLTQPYVPSRWDIRQR